MLVGLVPGSFKPYHAGHHALVKLAAAENDVVLVVYSTASRARKGEAPVSGDASSRIMTDFVAPKLPENVKLVSSGIPVRYVYEYITREEQRFIGEGTCDTLTVYADSDDISNFKNLNRYAPMMTAHDKIKLSTMTRGANGSPLVSGTAMRSAASRGDVAAFTNGLPDELRPRAKEILATLGFEAAVSPNALMLRAPSSLTEAARSTGSNFQAIHERGDLPRRRRDLLNELYLSCLLYERQLIVEDTGSYDSWTTSPNLFAKTFVAPFANAAKAVGVGALDVANVAKVPLKAIYYKLKGSDAPFQQAMTDYRRDKKKIDDLWKPIKKYSDEALSNDAQLLAFALAPKEYVGLALAKTFKQALVGKEGEDSAGLIGTLASTGFLPEEWSDKWKDYKSGRSESDEDDERAQQQAKEIKKAKVRLKDDLGKLSGLLLATKLADFKDRDEAVEKIKSLQNKLKSEKTSEISPEELGSLDSWSSDKGLLGRIRDEIRQSEKISRADKQSAYYMLRRVSENLRIIAEKTSGDRRGKYPELNINTRDVAEETFRISYRSLGKSFKEYSRCALFYAALAKSENLETLRRNISNLRVDLSDQIKEIKAAVDKANTPKDKEDAYKYVVGGAKAAAAKAVSENMTRVIQQIKDLSRQVLGREGTTEYKTIVASSEGKDFRETVQAAEKAIQDLHDSMRSGGNPDRAVTAIKGVLKVIEQKTGESL